MEYFELKEDGVQRFSLDTAEAFHQTNYSMVEASYAMALLIAKSKKPHNIGETMVKPCLLQCAKLVLGDTACNKLK